MNRAAPHLIQPPRRWRVATFITFITLISTFGVAGSLPRASAQAATEPTTQPVAWNLGSTVNAAAPSVKPPTPPSVVPVAEPHLLVISVDGMRPDCMLRADMPSLRSLMARGSFTLWARTTEVAVTTPSHVSMMTGVKPERHGINFNGDPPEDAHILVPTLFEYAKQAGLSTAMASGKRKFTLFTQTHAVDYSAITTEPTCPDAFVGNWAAQLVLEHKPRVMFVHFAGADVAGHGKGWGTPEQIVALTGIDKSIAVVLAAYDTAGLTDETYIIVSADHGGSTRTHGRDDPRSRFIPWLFAGPGVRQNFDLTRLGKDYDIATFDTFATSMFVLGLPMPADSDGKPIVEAFSDNELMKQATTAPAKQP